MASPLTSRLLTRTGAMLWLAGAMWGQSAPTPPPKAAAAATAPAAAPKSATPVATKTVTVTKPAPPKPKPPSAPSIAPQRALEIQNALIRAGYLEESSGVWDDKTATAMKQYQLDHHWQVKFVPDARALIALGLGPKAGN